MIFIGCVLGEILYRLEFQNVREHDRDIDDSILEFLNHNDNDKIILLKSIYDKIHSEGLVKELIAVLDSKFESYELKEQFQLLHQFELSLHGNNVINVEICLKKALGTNELAAKFLDYVKFSFFTEMNLKFKNSLKTLQEKFGREVTTKLTSIAALVMKVSLYYLDFIKDIIFIIFIKKLVPDVNDSFYFHLLVILIIIFCISEISKLHLAVTAKRSLNLSHRGFLITLLTFPFVPAILFYVIERLNYRNHLMKNSGHFDDKIGKITKLIARMKRNENTLENFPQLIIIVIIIGLSVSPTAAVTALKGTIDPKDGILYFTASLSILTIVRASVMQLKASLDGFLSFVGQLLFDQHYFKTLGDIPVLFPKFGFAAYFMALEVRLHLCGNNIYL